MSQGLSLMVDERKTWAAALQLHWIGNDNYSSRYSFIILTNTFTRLIFMVDCDYFTNNWNSNLRHIRLYNCYCYCIELILMSTMLFYVVIGYHTEENFTTQSSFKAQEIELWFSFQPHIRACLITCFFHNSLGDMGETQELAGAALEASGDRLQVLLHCI